MKYFFPLHFDGNNRGCEGIIKGTASILGSSKAELIAYTRNLATDEFLGITDYAILQEHQPITFFNKVEKTIENLISLNRNKIHNYYKYEYRRFINQITTNDIMLSTGGDMLCYGNNMVNTTNNILHNRGIRTILWGCSMGEKNYTPEKHETLKKFTLIYARESLTYDYFKTLGLKNIVCLPDPAFVLNPEETTLPSCFSNSEVIGVNINPYNLKRCDISSSFGHEIKKLLDYLLTYTDLHILLIPHVFWPGQDDREICNIIKNLYHTPRISVLCSSQLNYCQIRYVISKCKCFIGGRTHAVISAYSTCVPTIALGYSIKSKGIARDLKLPDNLVVDTVELKKNYNLLESFMFVENNYTAIKEHLCKTIPTYRAKAYQIKEYMKTTLK